MAKFKPGLSWEELPEFPKQVRFHIRYCHYILDFSLYSILYFLNNLLI